MKVSLKKKNSQLNESDTLIFFITQNDDSTPDLSPLQNMQISPEKINLSRFYGARGETIYIPLRDMPSIILCGTGNKNNLTADFLRFLSRSIVTVCSERKISRISIVPPAENIIPKEESVAALCEGIVLSNYKFSRYLSDDQIAGQPLIEEAEFISADSSLAGIINETNSICSNTLACRDLVNECSYASTPGAITKLAAKISKKAGITLKIFRKKDLIKMKMGLILAVNQGSSEEPALLVLNYAGGNKKNAPTAIVGKGITFDTGGINLKPTNSIETMRMDMAGAAAALYTIKTAAELKLKTNICAVLPLTENMISNTAFRPGDVYRSFSGKTVEIGNTDAEGRLILADAISYTEKMIKPSCIIDIATLTGACIQTFGEHVAAIITSDDNLMNNLFDAGEKTGERLWRLPLYEVYSENLKSDYADISNMSAEKNAGTIHAAAFLKSFVDKTPWAHIDIAGTAWGSKQRGCRPKNATGFGVRLLVQFLKSMEK